jgi:hypothetical protein
MTKRLSVGLLVFTASLAVVPVANAQNEGCVVSRDEVLEAIEQGMSEEDLFERFAGCEAVEGERGPVAPQAQTTDDVNVIVITDTGSTAFEAITSCGYHPQRKELTCPIEIRQASGFGGPPALQPSGSFEYVQFCVDLGAGLEPVNVNGVHVYDEAMGARPNWYFTAVVAADGDPTPNLFSQPLDGRTLNARAILSFAVSPSGDCNFVPTFGNQADFQIRLDP